MMNLKTREKEQELNKYLKEWVNMRYYEWNDFYRDENYNRRNGIYMLKRGNELLDFLRSIICNIEAHLLVGDAEDIIPSRFSSIDQFISFCNNFMTYIRENKHLLESNICGDNTSYIVSELNQIAYDINCMSERCIDIYVRDENVPDPYVQMRKSLTEGNVDEFIKQLNTVIKSIPYNIRKCSFNEAHFHIIVHAITSVIGLDPISEAETSDGRIDMMINRGSILYIFEFKYTEDDESCQQQALAQIKDKKYAESKRYKANKIVGVGVSFSGKKRCINGYIFENI